MGSSSAPLPPGLEEARELGGAPPLKAVLPPNFCFGFIFFFSQIQKMMEPIHFVGCGCAKRMSSLREENVFRDPEENVFRVREENVFRVREENAFRCGAWAFRCLGA